MTRRSRKLQRRCYQERIENLKQMIVKLVFHNEENVKALVVERARAKDREEHAQTVELANLELRRRNDVLERIFDRCRRAFGDHPALPPRRLQVKARLVPDESKFRMYLLTYPNDFVSSGAMTTREVEITMHLLIHGVRTDELSRCVHFMAELGGGRVAYVISDDALKHSAVADLVETIAPQMAEVLGKMIHERLDADGRER